MGNCHTDTIIDIINTHKVSKFAEIGVWKSKTTRKILKYCPSIKEYWAVDQWQTLPEGFGHMSRRTKEDWDNLHQFACTLCLYYPQLKIIRSQSVPSAEIFPAGYFDMVYIDADHRYETVKADICAWRSKIKSGGHLSGHDYGSSRHRGVKQAVDEIFQANDKIFQNNIKILTDYVWITTL